MSGIVGSKLNIRGSGLVAKLGTDGQHLLSSGAGKSVSYETVVDATYDDNKLQANIALLGFKTAVNGSLAKYNLQDQIIDEYTDATGVDASASTNERLTSGVYDGGTTSTPTVTEDADSKGTDGDYSWYKWTDTGSTGSYNTNTTQDHEWLIVAGGGSGARGGGGGGAGGYRNGTTLSLIGGNAYTITIGAGGAATTASMVILVAIVLYQEQELQRLLLQVVVWEQKILITEVMEVQAEDLAELEVSKMLVKLLL